MLEDIDGCIDARRVEESEREWLRGVSLIAFSLKFARGCEKWVLPRVCE